MFAVLASIAFSTGSLFFKVVKTKFEASPGFDLTHLIYDTNLLYAMILTVVLFSNDITFTWYEIGISVLSYGCINSALICTAWATVIGQAGPVTAISNLKSIFQTVFIAIMSQKLPNWQELVALALSILGATILIYDGQQSK